MVNQLKDYVRQWRIVWMHFRARSLREIDVPLGTTIIVAPHPDDEVFGCGGLMQRLITQGHEVHVIFMTGGEGSQRNCCELSEGMIKAERRKLAYQITPTLGVNISHLHFLNFPDGGVNNESEEMMYLKELLHELKPVSIFVPHWGEGWTDHVNTRAIIKELAEEDVSVYEYCVWLWYYNVWHLDWRHALLLRMTDIDKKNKSNAIDNYVIAKAPGGRHWCGTLPKLLLYAVKWKNELFFKT